MAGANYLTEFVSKYLHSSKAKRSQIENYFSDEIVLTRKFRAIGIGTHISKWAESLPTLPMKSSDQIGAFIETMPTFTDLFRLMYLLEIGIHRERANMNSVDQILSLLVGMLGNVGSSYAKQIEANVRLLRSQKKGSKRELSVKEIPDVLQNHFSNYAKRQGGDWVNQLLIDDAIQSIYELVATEINYDAESRKNIFPKKEIAKDIAALVKFIMKAKYSIELTFVTPRHVSALIK